MIRFAPLLFLMLAAAAPAPVPLATPPAGTPLDTLARRLVAQDMTEASRAGQTPLLLVGTAAIGGERPAVLVQLQSSRECGSAGCSTAVFVWTAGAYQRALDGISGQVSVGSTRHRGYADLQTDTERYVWNGRVYRSVRPAPDVSLRPARR